MTRILHLRSSRTIAGPERQIHELARAMRGSGFELEVALLSRPSATDPSPHPFLAELHASGIPAVEIADPDRSGRASRRALRSRLASGAFRIVHSHDPKANWVARAASTDAVARVATIHLHTRTTPALRLHAWIDRWNLRRFDRLIAVAESVASSWTGRGGVRPRIIVNGIDALELATRTEGERRDRAAGSAEGRSEERLLLAGRLSPQKGVDTLIRALPAILAARPGARLEIAGEGPERAALVDLAERTGVAPAIVWLGSRRDVLSLMSRATMLVHPSRFEGAPYAILEAMALATPIVATAVGAVPRLLGEGSAGRLVPPGSASALAAATIELLGRPGERRVLGERARARVVNEFPARRMADETAALYRELLP